MAILKLNTVSGGSITLQPTDTASNYTVSLPSANATLLTTTAIGSTVQAYDADLTSWAGKTAPTGDAVGTTDSQTLTNKTINLANNTVNTTLAQLNSAVSDADVASLAGSETLTNKTIGMAGALDCNNNVIQEIKTATFNSQTTIATTSGSITIDWTSAQNQKQTEPSSTITYTFIAPPGPCHLQLIIDSDGTSTAQTINWPSSVVWMGGTWAGANNKKAVINFWYDGSSYIAIGSNQV